ncbi:MAG TPA: CPBP family intramembrane glutamic endopeptidase, partial [Ferruginibacter sp.]|nr:CPBP family intramembrane glutamic endopeptidase [Ferruginibacter sp.]
FFPAMFEEVFFRGGLQNLLERWWKNPFLAILVTSLLFSFIHLSIYLFLSRAVLGFVLGLMYHKTRNIWVNIIAHFLNNSIAVAQLFYMNLQKQKLDISKIDPKIDWWYGIIALIATVFLIRLLERYSKQNRANIEAKEQLLLARHAPANPFEQTGI